MMDIHELDELRDKITKIIRDRTRDFERKADKNNIDDTIIVELRKLHYDIDGVFADVLANQLRRYMTK